MRVLLTALLLCIPLSVLSQEVQPVFNAERIEQATVFLAQVDSTTLTTRCVGSGTIVRSDGVILTNAHHTITSSVCNGDMIVVYLSLDPTLPPVPKYRAEIAQVDEGLDLALLRISEEFDGRAIDVSARPTLPFVELGDSNTVALDETITFVGYGGVGNAPVQAIRGTIRGFIAEASGGEKSWMKTSAVEEVSGIMTGGGIYNDSGQLIGIPTSAPIALQTLGSTCLRLEDANGDGVVNEQDACIPIGDNVSVSRPADFARPLIRSASLDLIVESLTVPRLQPTPQARPLISRIFASPSVVDGNASTVVASLPAGTTSQYIFFDYANMTPNTVYEVRVTVDGIPNTTFSLPPVKWSGAEKGVWYVGSSGQPYPNGRYEYRIFVDGAPSVSYALDIGGSANQNPTFSNLVFGLLDTDGSFAGNGYVLPTGAIATARFIYTNMRPDLAWTAIWYYNGNEIVRTNDVWTLAQAANGSQSINLQPEGGLPIGSYRVELYIGSTLACTGDFVIAGSKLGARPIVFTKVEYFSSDSVTLPSGQPANSFPDGVQVLYTQFDWQQIAIGTDWRLEWLVDDTVFYEQKAPWSGTESGTGFSLRLTTANGVPDGTYTIRLYVNNVLMESGSASVGIGQLRIDRLTEATGVTLKGKIVDAETLAGIPGVTFILISADYSIADFTWQQDQIYALGITDRNGNFQLDRSLEFDAPYSVLITASGYLPLSADGFEIAPDSANPLEMLISLTKD